MAGRCLPERPRFRNDAEKRVWQGLRARLRDVDVLLHGVRFCGWDGDWEADLVVLMPEGFATVEVKGGQVRYRGGEYMQLLSTGPKSIDLADQAVSEKYLVRRYLNKHARWGLASPRMAHFVALPDTALTDEDFGPGLPRRLVLAKGEERQGMTRIYDVLIGPLENQPKTPPGVEGVDLAAEILGGRGESQVEVAALLHMRDDVVARLTDEQQAVLDLTSLMRRYQVVGGPGSGKTFLALEQARRWAADGLQVAFVAYSRGLTTWVERAVQGWPDECRKRLQVTTFHALGRRWGAEASTDADQLEWDEVIPRRMGELASVLGVEERYDALVVDEAQDFGSLWWPPLLAGLRDPVDGRVAVYSDQAQQIFGRDGGEALGMPRLPLRHNLRNAGPIVETVNALLREGMSARGGYGPEVRFIACGSDEAIAAADDEAERLIEAGWSHRDLALLTTNHRHPMQIELVTSRGRDGYWEAFWDDEQFFYCTVPGFKGLERPAVVVAVDGFRDEATARETLLVGLSRARDQLVVCGDPELLRRVGGKQLMKRLHVST